MSAFASGYRSLVGPIAKALGVVGALLLVVGSVLPWSRYTGFPGNMAIAGPGGARLGSLLLGLVGILLVRPVPGGKRAVRAAASLGFTIALTTVFFIAYAHGGLVHVAAGGFVAVAGGLLFVLGAFGLDVAADKASATMSLPDKPWRLYAEWAVTLALPVLGLWAFVVGLGITSANVAGDPDTVIRGAISLNALTNDGEFLGFLFMVIGLILVASRTGLLTAMNVISKQHKTLFLAAGMISAAAFPFTQSNGYALRIAASIGVFAAAAVGLNIVVGLAGLLDLGYIAFFGVGAYFAAIFSGSVTSHYNVHLPFGLVIILGALVAGLFGVLLGAPTLRLRGDYLAIVTLGFGEIFRITANNLDGNSGPSLTNGPNGISNIPDLTLPGGFNFGDNHNLFGIDLPFQANYYWLEIILVAVVMTAFLRLSESRIGRAWVAIREDELAAAATGINTTQLKLLAFALGATLAGAAGTVNAHVVKVATPDSFTFLESALLLAAVILGGMGTVPGALLGATVLYLLPEKLRFLQDLRLLVFGIVLVLIMRLRPEGLVPSKRRAREFHDTEHRPDALDAPPGHGGVVA